MKFGTKTAYGARMVYSFFFMQIKNQKMLKWGFLGVCFVFFNLFLINYDLKFVTTISQKVIDRFQCNLTGWCRM